MKLTNTLVILLSTALPAAVNAAIAIGNQIKAGGVHYNVAWTEGVSACGNNVNIASESSKVCDRDFIVDGNTYKLVGCTDPNTGYAQKPAKLLRGDGSEFGNCAEAYKKLGCSGSTHDVVKRYLCG